MSRPRGFADLAGRRVGIWGIGVEGTATLARVGPLAREIVLVDDVADEARGVLATAHGGLDALAACDVVLKSPGIPRRRADVVALEHGGTIVTSALNLWLHDADRSHVIGVTGTKGKSTTTSLITFMLTELGHRAQSAGNIGVPPYVSETPFDGWTVLEVSSFQAVDIEDAPGIVVVTSLGADHLDWHGSLRQYHDDKLSLTRAAGEHVTLVASDEALRPKRESLGGSVRFVEPVDDSFVRALGLLGNHNASNIALALVASAQATGLPFNDVARQIRAAANHFAPLAGRLTLVRTFESVRYVDDGLATAALPTVAALSTFADDPVALIVGGYDRGIDYTSLAEAVAERSAPTFIAAMPDAGERILATIREQVVLPFVTVDDMEHAVTAARRALPDGGVVLFSPAAASFSRYANWRERSDHFARVVHDLR